MIRAALLDDEPQHNRTLQMKLLELAEDIEVVASFSDEETALILLPSIKIDVLFLDVEMPRLNGFQLLRQLEKIDFEVIFVTAFHEYAIQAIRFSAFDFLTKPVDRDDLHSALSRLREKNAQKINPENRSAQYELLLDLINKKNTVQEQRIALPTASDIRFVFVSDIIRLESDSNYTTFFLKNGDRIVVSRTMKEYERLLESYAFLRTNRSNIINLGFVNRYIKAENAVELSDGTLVDVAPVRKEELLRRMTG